VAEGTYPLTISNYYRGLVAKRNAVYTPLNAVAEAARELLDAMWIHYNFIGVYQAIGQTPSQPVVISLNLGENKVESLMRQAAVCVKDIQEPTGNGLGIRVDKVQIFNGYGCIKVKP
jgi:hypothetical protein